jgi:hypothetical protein
MARTPRHALVKSIRLSLWLETQASIERLRTRVDDDVQIDPSRAGIESGRLGPLQQRRAKTLSARFRQEADIDDPPERRRTVQVEAPLGQGRTRPLRALDDPEIGAGKIADEVMVLQAELIVQQGISLRLRPCDEPHLIGLEARKETSQEPCVRIVRMTQRQPKPGKIVGTRRLRRPPRWKCRPDGQRFCCLLFQKLVVIRRPRALYTNFGKQGRPKYGSRPVTSLTNLPDC